jgi:hypothetical protein
MHFVSRFESSSDIFSLQQQMIIGNQVIIIFIFILIDLYFLRIMQLLL